MKYVIILEIIVLGAFGYKIFKNHNIPRSQKVFYFLNLIFLLGLTVYMYWFS